MPRRPKNFLLDERILDALDSAAKKAGYKSPNKFVEQLLFNTLKMSGNLGADAEPLPEGRGGKRKKKQLPNDPADTADSLSKDSSGSFEERSPTGEEPIDLLPETTARSNDLNTWWFNDSFMVLNYESCQKWYVLHSDSYIKGKQRTPEGEGFSVEVVKV